MPLRVFLDRALPIPVGVQLKGQIEYGIVSGTLKPGERLPSVREMAIDLGLAHVTVSHVYSALRRDGLILMRPGMGTYVSSTGDGWHNGDGLGDLRRLVDNVVDDALAQGYTPRQISQMVTARLAGDPVRRPIVALVGLFAHATDVYARTVAEQLADLAPDVMPFLIEGLWSGGVELRDRARQADVVLTMANRSKDVQDLLGPGHPPVHSLAFVTHPETVRQLQELPRGIQLGVISTFGEFLPTMLHGIGTYVSSDNVPLCAVVDDAERVRAIMATADVVVYASGSEAILSDVPRGKPALEYLHIPEPSSVQAVRRLLEQLPGTVGTVTRSVSVEERGDVQNVRVRAR